MNEKWYYLCDLYSMTAIEFMQIPEVWGNITGMADLDDEHLQDLKWAGVEHRGFLTEARAKKIGIDPESMKQVVAPARLAVEVEIRQRRNFLLAETDFAATVDRWSMYTPAEQAEIAAYRQELRDLTKQADPLNPVWPTLPRALS